MESAILGAVGGAVAALVLVALVGLVRRRSRSRADLVAMLEAAQREVDDLRLQLDIATARLERHVGPAHQQPPEYVITDAGTAAVLFEPGDLPAPTADPVEVPDRLVLSATVGAPLVRAAALAHGVRRALSAESRNRIWFEMRREVRSARKRRRRMVREHLRQVRAEERASEAI